MLFGLSACAETPHAFLVGVASKRKWPRKEYFESLRLVEDLVMHHSDEHIQHLIDFEGTLQPMRLKRAWGIYLQWQLVAWTRRQNNTQGVAPSTNEILGTYNDYRKAMPEGPRPSEQAEASRSTARVFAYRWRRFWGGKYAAMRTREYVSATEMR